MSKASSSRRYVTRGVAEAVGSEIQAVLWGMIDEARSQGESLDDRQVFDMGYECACGSVFQRVTHSQERPPFEHTRYYRDLGMPFTGRVWVLYDGERFTMLLPEEY